MNTCWAAALGDCEGGISREHLVSQSLFPGDKVTVHGLHWCKNAPITVGLASLTAKIFCRKHNSELGVLDTAVKQTAETFVDVLRLVDVRSKMRLRSYTIKHFMVDGPLLERWFLRTMINVGFESNWIIGEGSHAAGTPNDELVRIAFGRAQFRPKAGLYSAAHAGETITWRDGLNYVPKRIGNNLLAGMFSLGGYRFFLNLLTQEFTEHRGSPLIYRTVKHWYQVPDHRGRQVRSHRLDIAWP
jgi:hypothetical protein